MAGADRMDAEEGSICYEAGSGVSGRVQGDPVFLGNWEWVCSSLPAPTIPPREPQVLPLPLPSPPTDFRVAS